MALAAFAVLAPSTRVRITAVDQFGQLGEAVLPGLLIASLSAVFAGAAAALVMSRHEGLSHRDLLAEGRGLISALFAFLAGGYLLAFKPMTNLFNSLELRIADGLSRLDVSHPKIAFAVGVIAVWLWCALAVGLTLRGTRSAEPD